MEKVKLHRCPLLSVKLESVHSCWRVQQALDDQGIEFEIVKVPVLPRSRRTEVIGLTGQQRVPVIEFADGTAYRAESKEMAARIRAGKLFDGRGEPGAGSDGGAGG